MNHAMSHDDEFELVLLVEGSGRSSHPRSPVPKMLVDAGIPELLWHATFDEAKKRSAAFAMAKRSVEQAQNTVFPRGFIASILLLVFVVMLPVLYDTDSADYGIVLVPPIMFIVIIPVVCCVGPTTKTARNTYAAQIRAWPEYVQGVRLLFQFYGVFVTTLDARGRHTLTTPMVGAIRFSTCSMDDEPSASSVDVETAATGAPDTYLPVATAIDTIMTMTTPIDDHGARSSKGMVDDLEALQNLRERGVLTETEFQNAKAKLLRDHGVMEVVVPAIAVSEVLPVTVAGIDNNEGGDPLTRLI